MLTSVNNSNSLAIDVKDVANLRQAAQKNSPEALKQTAKQFEALFMNMIMKSMREATPQDGLFDNQQTKMYTSMLDQQVSQNLANRGVGLADMLVRQLSSQVNKPAPTDVETAISDAAAPARHSRKDHAPAVISGQGLNSLLNGTPATSTTPAATTDTSSRSSAKSAHVRNFEDRLTEHAEEASRRTGIPAKFMLGQAALESGWGRREIKAADGTPSHNLFGIKATAGWTGKTVDIPTTEYVNGRPQTKMQKFRAYDSYAEGFQDYARMLASNPRYEKVLANAQDAAGFAHGLQKAGYATDPHYAAKLTQIIKKSLSA